MPVKRKLLIIGGGFAGFWSVMSAFRQSREINQRSSIEIFLVDPDNIVSIRPDQKEPLIKEHGFKLDRYLKPLGIDQIYGRVIKMVPENNRITINTAKGMLEMQYDYLILATGVSLNIPHIPGISFSFRIDSNNNIEKLEDHLIQLATNDFNDLGDSTVVVVGTDFIGLELVTSIAQKIETIQAYHSGKKAAIEIILIESGLQIGYQFSESCRSYILQVLSQKSIEVILNCEVQEIDSTYIKLNNGTRIFTKTVVWTKGFVASSLTSFFKGPKDGLNRLFVNSFLKLSDYDNVIAAGNVAHLPNDETPSPFINCQYAQLEGRWAGHNAINDLFDIPLKEYIQPDYIKCPDLGQVERYNSNGIVMDDHNAGYSKIALRRHINRISMFPWLDVEATVRASYPEITYGWKMNQ